MDLYRIIYDLVQERNRIQRIIESLESMNPGFSAKNLRRTEPRKRRGRKSMDPAARAEVSERMKRYWAKRRTEPTHGGGADSSDATA